MSHSPVPRARLVAMAAARLLMVVPLLMLLLLLPAGTFDFWQAWVYMALLVTPMVFNIIYLTRRDPGLLERRMNLREQRDQQRRVIAWSLLYFLLIYVIPGLDRRYGWSQVPWVVTVVADVIILLSYILFTWVLRENSYASRVVEVGQEQRVITTGPYALVRHPMYLGVIVLFGLTPLALGSYWGLIPSALLPVLLVGRVRDEEALLLQELPGYREYTEKVRYRLLPGIW